MAENNPFTALLTDYCNEYGLPGNAVQRIAEGAPIRIGDILFAISGGTGPYSDCLYLYGDLGLPPEQHREQICRMLLTFNMTLHPLTGHALMISPLTGHMLLAATQSIAASTARRLHDVLVSMAAIIRDVRQSIAADFPAGQAEQDTAGAGMDRLRFMRGRLPVAASTDSA